MVKKNKAAPVLNDQSVYGQTILEHRRTNAFMGKIIIGLGALCFGLAVTLFVFIAKQPEPIVNNYAVDAEGRITKLEPLNVPIGIERVSAFTSETIRKAFTMNYRDAEDVMGENVSRFSSGAFSDYRKLMTDGSNSIVGVLKANNAAVETVPLAMRLQQTTEVKGRYAWIIEIDVNRTFFSGASQKTTPFTYVVTVVRESSLVTPRQLVVYSLIERARTPNGQVNY